MEKKKILAAVFASLQGLEKCCQTSKRLHEASRSQSELVSRSLKDQNNILSEMRRAANKLQLQIAGDDWGSIVRSLHVFYGLRQMVRPEIMATFQSLANKELKLPKINQDAVVH